MTGTVVTLLALALSCAAQTTFDVASIHTSELSRRGGEGRGMEVIQPSPDSLTMRNVSLKGAIRWAYHVNYAQVQGPGWLDGDRFDISARAAGPVTGDQLRVMLQALLMDRFKMEVHRQTKELQAYVLTVGKGGLNSTNRTHRGKVRSSRKRNGWRFRCCARQSRSSRTCFPVSSRRLWLTQRD